MTLNGGLGLSGGGLGSESLKRGPLGCEKERGEVGLGGGWGNILRWEGWGEAGEWHNNGGKEASS